MFVGQGIDGRVVISPKGFTFPNPPYPYEPKRIGAFYREFHGSPDDNFVPPEVEEESETSLPSSQSDSDTPSTDSCHDDDLEPASSPDSPKYEPSPPGEMPEWYMYEIICSDPQKLDWEDPLATEFLAQAGLGCYNLQKGTNLQFSGGPHGFHDHTDFEEDDVVAFSVIMRDSASAFETRLDVKKEEEEEHCLSLITTLHTPQTPEVEGGIRGFEKLALDDFFKGRMPYRLPHDSIGIGNMRNKPKFYLMGDSELEEYKELFLLYAEVTLFSHWQSIRLVEWAKPLELKYVIVQAWEPKPKKKAKAENANFYITFSTRHGYPYHTVTRRTTTGKPNQVSLEFKMLMC